MEYGEDKEEHLAGGKREADVIRGLLSADGAEPAAWQRFGELGCSNGRVLRWFADWAEHAEGWGLDINSHTLHWASQHLRPPFHFAVSTTGPHLFFPDSSFGLLYACSVFTHVDDLSFSWFCEIYRVLEPGGYFFLTVHDEAAWQILETMEGHPLRMKLSASPNIAAFEAGDVDMLSASRDHMSQVFFRRAFLLERLEELFQFVAVVEGTMGGFQTGVLVRKALT